ncbi:MULTISPECIES: hypothetical protein [Devosia]|jgi:hypothetical protein|uniref:hypothetical protein n=1 Tax=Devosia TaxID=46913 RepID=UPI00130039CE|nr:MULTISPECIES: hypothetical protein [Devosia]
MELAFVMLLVVCGVSLIVYAGLAQRPTAGNQDATQPDDAADEADSGGAGDGD